MGVVFNSLPPNDAFNEAVFNEDAFNETVFNEVVCHEIYRALHDAIRCINANRLQCYCGS